MALAVSQAYWEFLSWSAVYLPSGGTFKPVTEGGSCGTSCFPMPSSAGAGLGQGFLPDQGPEQGACPEEAAAAVCLDFDM